METFTGQFLHVLTILFAVEFYDEKRQFCFPSLISSSAVSKSAVLETYSILNPYCCHHVV